MKIVNNEKCMIKGCENPVTGKDFLLILWHLPEATSVRICKGHIQESLDCPNDAFKEVNYEE